MKKKRLKKNAKDEKPAVFDQTDARVGCVCVSTAGHDAGLKLAIIAGIDRDHVFVADGKTRKLGAPKKKKMRHLSMLTKLSEQEAQVIRGKAANDSFLRKALSKCSKALPN